MLEAWTSPKVFLNKWKLMIIVLHEISTKANKEMKPY